MWTKLSEEQRAKREKVPSFFMYPIQAFQLKKVYILPFFVDFWQQYADKFHLFSLLSLGVVNRINALETMEAIFIWRAGEW